MKFKHLIITFFALSAMLSSCVSRTDCEIALEGGIPINLEGAINQNTTKVNADGFEDGDGLGPL